MKKPLPPSFALAVAALALCFPLNAAPPDGAAAAAPEAITRETCAACHEKEAAAFGNARHGRGMASRGKDTLETSCVACHGPAEAHVADPSKANIRRRPSADACLSCHRTSGSLLLTNPAHARNRVACLDCHSSGHLTVADRGSRSEPLLLAAPRILCARCHQAQARSFALPYAHRDGAVPFDCTACHSSHGQGRAGRLALQGKGAACADCHTEKTQPWVFPHPPRDDQGCVSCHQPHGSTNPRLLTRRNVRAQCLECHANVPAFHDLTKPRYQSCLSCHVAIHGSNHDSRLRSE